MWNFSRPPAAASRWRRVTPDQRAQQDRTGDALRRETAILEAGGAVPASLRRRCVRDPASPVGPAEAAELWSFLGMHGHAIRGLLEQAAGERQQLALARGYRAVRAGEPGAHEGWGQLLAALCA